MNEFVVYPAIDLRDGRCVRLYQGDYDRETIYGEDPVAQALTFVAAGAQWVHVVDLDAARSGDPVNRPAVAAIAAAVGVPVQTGGGVRSVEAAEVLATAGVSRVVIGTAALEQTDLVAQVSRRQPVAVGLDVRGRDVAVRGWEIGSGVHIKAAVARFDASPVAAYVVTQILRDGTGQGPDLELYRELLAVTDTPIGASGGVGKTADVSALAALVVSGRRLAGVILGRALYDGSFSLEEAIAAAAA